MTNHTFKTGCCREQASFLPRVAIDGAFFHGDASKGSIKTRNKLAERLAALDRDI